MRRTFPLLVGLAILASACSAASTSSSAEPVSPTSEAANLPVQVTLVNYELLANTSNRLLVGLILPDNRLVAYGTVQMRFQGLDANGQPAGSVSQVVTGSYLPVPGTEPGDPGADPRAIAPSTVRGVYELEGVRFGTAGRWVVEVAARVQDYGVIQGSTTLDVLDAPKVPAVGHAAPRSDNPVIGDPGVPPSEIDSRASIDGAIPDPELHRVSIADAIRQGKPAVVVFSTPVYCVSRFCGPVTDLVRSLRRRYADRVAFIHVEIWKDYEANQVSRTAAEWLERDGEVTEPWCFMIDGNGQIAARWDNVFTRPELEDGLQTLLS